MKAPLPIGMLETIAADIAENTVLLELIYKHSNEDHETDCAMACLIRSMKKTLDTTNEYIKSLSDSPAPPKGNMVRTIFLMRYFTRPLQPENSKSLRIFITSFTSQIATMVNPQCIWQLQFLTMRLRFAVN
ncbi:TPA: hypothetical protein MJA60_23725 [Klebsiella pneumoniae]|nr:Uncharacterised protein [Klebsiella pneumoniae]STS28481.1 Uncharacterised protein [Klebsiella pneumoniae]STS45289.1 Uncharacterised protein [Klebsiella pneumoniae]STS50476.1 Uncharacterised protein [Klebsiella pneumoniae]HBY9763046.1 hypothetical protein [Klebsiella pneumoniae]